MLHHKSVNQIFMFDSKFFKLSFVTGKDERDCSELTKYTMNCDNNAYSDYDVSSNFDLSINENTSYYNLNTELQLQPDVTSHTSKIIY